MKQLRQQHPYYNSKAWTSLDCLLISLPILPVSHSSRPVMRSNMNLQMSDSRRISPQTTSSSGYHSDLSSATSNNQSPQSIHEILPLTLEKSPSLSSSSHSQNKATSSVDTSIHEKPASTKNLSRLSSFLRRQYERARSKIASTTTTTTRSSYHPQKLLSTQPSKPTVVATCSKGTSTTPVSHLSEDNYTFPTKQQQQHSSCNQKPFHPHHHPPPPHYLSSVYKQSSYAEPVYSIYVHPKLNHHVKVPPSYAQKNYASIHDCYSQPVSQRTSSYTATNNSQSYVSYRQPMKTSASHYDSRNLNSRHQYYPVEPSSCQNYYPYRYATNHNYETQRSNYAPLSDFASTKNSAFKPIGHKPKQVPVRPLYQVYEQIAPSDDPCDLEVAQYFPQTSHWSNPNYFDIYANDLTVTKMNYTETLC